ncbi:MAG: hypothetical protein IPP37_03185 [Saprospiraceae bacterium]|nr:hypothetical protein [Saprospiraceae bacterium]
MKSGPTISYMRELGDSHAASSQRKLKLLAISRMGFGNVVNKKRPCYLVEVNKSSDILLAIDWIKDGVKAVLTGVSKDIGLVKYRSRFGRDHRSGVGYSRREYGKSMTPYTNAAVMFKARYQGSHPH